MRGGGDAQKCILDTQARLMLVLQVFSACIELLETGLRVRGLEGICGEWEYWHPSLVSGFETCVTRPDLAIASCVTVKRYCRPWDGVVTMGRDTGDPDAWFRFKSRFM